MEKDKMLKGWTESNNPPQDNIKVIVAYDDGTVGENKYFSKSGGWQKWEINTTVTHWMALPIHPANLASNKSSPINEIKLWYEVFKDFLDSGDYYSWDRDGAISKLKSKGISLQLDPNSPLLITCKNESA